MNRRALARRAFLRFGAGAMGGAALGGVLGAGKRLFASPATRPAAAGLPLISPRSAGPARVALVKGKNRYDMVFESLKLIEDEVLGSIGRKRILIKPNIVLSDCAACVTHVDAVRAVLDFLGPHVKDPILIGESGVQDRDGSGGPSPVFGPPDLASIEDRPQLVPIAPECRHASADELPVGLAERDDARGGMEDEAGLH